MSRNHHRLYATTHKKSRGKNSTYGVGSSKPLLTGIPVELIEIDSGANCLSTKNSSKKEKKGVVVEDYQTLKVALHNINGIKGNFTKLELLLD